MWTPHGFYMDTMWYLCGHNIVTTLTPHGFQVDTIWFPCGYHVLSMCTPCGFQVVTKMFQMWTPYNFHVKITLFLYGQNMVSIWTPCGFHMDTMWLPHGFQVDTIWFLCRYHVVSMCTPCGFQVDTMWFLGGLSLHLNHLIAWRMGISFQQFGTLPIGFFLSNLDSRQLMTSPGTLLGQFRHMSIFGNSRAVWVICNKRCLQKINFFLMKEQGGFKVSWGCRWADT